MEDTRKEYEKEKPRKKKKTKKVDKPIYTLNQYVLEPMHPIV